MSSSSFVSCPRRSDRGTASRIGKFYAVLDIKQSAARRLNKQASRGFFFFVPALTFPASQCRLYQSRLGAKTLFHSLLPCSSPPPTLLRSPLHGAASVCGRFKIGKAGRRSRRDEIEQGDFFFFSQYPKKTNKKQKNKKQNRQTKCSFIAKSSSMLHLDVCTQTLTHTHSDTITCTFNSDKRTEDDCGVFYNCFSENVLHFVFTAGNAA